MGMLDKHHKMAYIYYTFIYNVMYTNQRTVFIWNKIYFIPFVDWSLDIKSTILEMSVYQKMCVPETTIVRQLSLRNVSRVFLLFFPEGLLMDAQMH